MESTLLDWRAYSRSARKGVMERYELAIVKNAFKLIFSKHQ
jgi:hypothetical protein